MDETTRAEIEALEREITEKQSRLVQLRRDPDPVDGNTRLEGAAGPVSLATLFGTRDDLVLVHNMGAGCAYCTLWADGFNGIVPHLEDRAAFVVCSPDAPEAQRAFATSRGWTFRMVSDPGGAFTRAMGFLEERDGRAFHLPGVSAFHRGADGAIRRTGHAPFGPGDPFCAAWHLFALLDGGAGDWHPRFRYGA